MANPQDLDVWREKLEFLLKEEVVSVDNDRKFELRKRINEARRKIEDLASADTPSHVEPVPRVALKAYDKVAEAALNDRLVKLRHLKDEIAITADPGRKFELYKQIEETNRAIAELQIDEQPKRLKRDNDTYDDHVRYLIDGAPRYRGTQIQMLAARICIVLTLWLPILLTNTMASLTSVIFYGSALLYAACESVSIKRRLDQVQRAIAQIEVNTV